MKEAITMSQSLQRFQQIIVGKYTTNPEFSVSECVMHLASLRSVLLYDE